MVISDLTGTLVKVCTSFIEHLHFKYNLKAKIIETKKYTLKMDLQEKGAIRFYINKSKEIKLVNGNLDEDDFENILLFWEIFRNGEDFFKGIHVFVDGSFMNGKIGFGFLIVKDSNIVKKVSGKLSSVENLKMKNVAGEIKAVIEAIEFCKVKNWKEIYLHYDYEGLKKWATMEWKANNIMTKNYQNYMRNNLKNLKIKWVKEKAHGSSMLNLLADKLAKMSLKTED